MFHTISFNFLLNYSRYHWIKNGESFNYEDRGDQIFKQPDNGTLVFLRPQKTDSGQYQCFAENEFGIATSNSVTLQSVFLKTFKPSSTFNQYFTYSLTHCFKSYRHNNSSSCGRVTISTEL